MSLSKAEAAARLGVPEREVLDVADAEGDYRVSTTDGVAYLVTDDGKVAYLANYPPDTLFPVRKPPPAPEPTGEDGDEDDEGEGGDEDGGEEEAVPDGAIGEVLAWVNRDQARAARALRAERDRQEPRQTLVVQLERLAQP